MDNQYDRDGNEPPTFIGSLGKFNRISVVRLQDTGEHQTRFMGWSGNNGYSNFDNHNNPQLLVDNQNYLHFISGARNHHIWHRRSKTPIDTPAWTASIPDSTSKGELFTPGPQSSAAGIFYETELQGGVDYLPFGRFMLFFKFYINVPVGDHIVLTELDIAI